MSFKTTFQLSERRFLNRFHCMYALSEIILDKLRVFPVGGAASPVSSARTPSVDTPLM